MRIVHVTPTLLPEAGGLSEAVLRIADGQMRAGHDVYGLVPNGRWNHRGEGGIKPVNLQVWAKGWGPSSGLQGICKNLAPDILHLHGLWEPFLHAAARWARQNGVPYGLTPHGMEGEWHRRNRRWTKAFLGGACRYPETWARAAWIQVLNKSEERLWQSRTKGEVLRIPNGVAVREPSGPEPSWLAECDEVPLIVFLGRLHPQKDPETALEIFMRVKEERPDVRLVMAGPDGGLLHVLQARLRDYAWETHVQFPGWIGPDEKEHLWARADVCLHPSRSEGHSLTLLEAAAHGVPVLMTPEAAFPELAACGGARVFQGGAEQGALEMLDLLNQPEKLASMGAAARDEVRRTYSWDRAVNDLLSACERVCPAAGGSFSEIPVCK